MVRFSFISFLLIMISCTSNPFWNDPTKNELKLNGTATAENKHTDVPISIWMESFDQYTITDSDGNFSIPINNSQSGTGNISGPVKLYFFIYNYHLDSATVFFTNGELSKDQTDFSTNGDLIKRVELTKILSGEMEFQLLENRFYDQDTVLLTFDGGIHSTISISLYKYIYKDEFNFHSGLLFRSIDNDNVIIYRFLGIDEYGNYIQDQIHHVDYEKNETLLWSYYIVTNQIYLAPGSYEVFPYFLIHHEYFPDGLVENLGGESAFTISEHYLKLPLDIVPDTLMID